jgi:phosphoribosylanthranilate isomerase
MTQVKICGLRHTEQALAAAEAGATMLGFVFAPSRRRVDPNTAKTIVEAVRRTHPRVLAVGVFVDESPEAINSIAKTCGLDYAQLGGDEPDEIAGKLEVHAIKTLSVRTGENAVELARRAEGVSAAYILHLDAGYAESRGGTGRRFDWSAASTLTRPFLLAGGLNERNVGDAIRMTRPWGVDVSSGVERAGEKDAGLIRGFVAAALTASGRAQERFSATASVERASNGGAS